MLVDQRQVGLEDAGAVRTLLGGRVGLAELRRVGRVRVASQVALALEQRAEVVEDEGEHSAGAEVPMWVVRELRSAPSRAAGVSSRPRSSAQLRSRSHRHVRTANGGGDGGLVGANEAPRPMPHRDPCGSGRRDAALFCSAEAFPARRNGDLRGALGISGIGRAGRSGGL